MARVAVHEEVLPGRPEQVFALLCTPSAIRAWWGCTRAIVLPREGGGWAAAWGRREDRPDLLVTGTIGAYEPHERLRLVRYRSEGPYGGAPFDAEMVLEFTLEPRHGGTLLRVLQDGIPDDRRVDAFHAACLAAWRDTFAAMRRLLQEHSARPPLGAR